MWSSVYCAAVTHSDGRRSKLCSLTDGVNNLHVKVCGMCVVSGRHVSLEGAVITGGVCRSGSRISSRGRQLQR